MKKFLINIFLILNIIFLIFFLLNMKREDRLIEKKSFEFLSENKEVKAKEYQKEEIDEKYNGYNVCAKLEIPTIFLKTDILENYTPESLNISVTKLCGVEPNANGNFCVIGHNFKKANMFSNLKKLNLNDRIFITDRNVGKVEYEIFNIDIVLPENTNCLLPTNNNEKEVTLITCTNDSKKRIIIKAREVI